jgi:hypothetical protein
VAAAGLAVYVWRARAKQEAMQSGGRNSGAATQSTGADQDRRIQQEQDQAAAALQDQLAKEQAAAQTPAHPNAQAASQKATNTQGAPAATVPAAQSAPKPAAPPVRNSPSPQTAPATNPEASDAEHLRVLSGTWSGTYLCSQGVTGATLQIVAESDQKVLGLLQFAVPNSAPGAYFVRGTYNPASNRLEMNFSGWKNQPPGYSAAGFSGIVNFASGEFKGVIQMPGCSTFSIRKQ